MRRRMSQKEEDAQPIRIINRLADGTIRDSMKGYVIHYNEKTKGIYLTVAAVIQNIEARERDGAV